MTETARKPPRRWLWLALGLSLSLNLLVAGVVLGALWSRGAAPERPARIDLAAPPYIAALDAADRAALRAAWRAEGPDLRRLRAERQSERAALAAAVRASPFDAAAVAALLQAQSDRLADRQALSQRLLLERLATMTEAERAAFAERLEAGAPRGPGRSRPEPDRPD